MKRNIRNLIIIGISYLFIIAPILVGMYEYNEATFGGWDAVTQMYPVLAYVKQFWENVFHSVLSGKIEIPMVEWTLGMGDDLITALNWHGFGDPMYIFSVFVSESNLPHFYSFLFYFRVLLGGVGFYYFVKYICPDKSDLAYIAGALSYCFVGFMVQSNFHVIFVHMMVYLPIMYLGALKVLDKKRRGLLAISSFLFSLSGFYFLYIASIGLGVFVIYQLVRRKVSIKDSISFILQMVAEYLIGLGLGSVYLIPSIIGFLGSNRAIMVKGISLFLSWEEIKNMAINIFLPSYEEFPVLSVTTICFICVMLLFLDRKRHNERIVVCALILLACIPMVSCIMSGFGEIYDRWEILITFYAAYLVVIMWDDLIHLNRLQIIMLALSALGIYGMARLFDMDDHERFGITVRCYIVISAMLIIVAPICRKIKREKLFYLSFFIVAVISIRYNWKEAARTREYSYVQERNVVEEFGIGDDEEFYRIDNSRTAMELRIGQNQGLLMGYASLSEYFSIENSYFTNALLSWNTNAQATGSHMNTGMDSRTVLETLASVKYYLWNSEQPTKIPYGYIPIKTTEDGEWTLYENPYALPIIYGYDSVFEKNQNQTMNGFEIQNIMIQSAMVENYQGTLPSTENLDDNLHENQTWLVSITDGVQESEDGISLLNGGTVVLRTNLQEDSENSIIIDGLPEQYSGYINVMVNQETIGSIGNNEGYHNGSLGLNLGTVEDSIEAEVTLSFSKAIDFSLNQVKIYSYDMSSMEEYVRQRKVVDYDGVDVGVNTITAQVDLENDKFICASVPYSKGWTATVDGEQAKVYCVNDMYLGIDVSEGQHTIIFSYKTPYIGIGIFLMCFSIGIIIIYFIYTNIESRRSSLKAGFENVECK